jgi:hypothetical protein
MPSPDEKFKGKSNLSEEDRKAQAMLMEANLTKAFGKIETISLSELPDA